MMKFQERLKNESFLNYQEYLHKILKRKIWGKKPGGGNEPNLKRNIRLFSCMNTRMKKNIKEFIRNSRKMKNSKEDLKEKGSIKKLANNKKYYIC